METLRLLIVDDEPGMRLGARRALRQHMFPIADLDMEVTLDIDMAETGQEALDKIAAQPFDLVLLDYKLPDISGLDILMKLQQQKLDLLVIMITAYSSLEVAISATKNGAFDFLAKPFTPEDLKSCIQKGSRHLLIQRRARQLAEEKRQVRFQFLSVLSHELKAPLNAIQSLLNILQARTLGTDMAAYDDIVLRALRRVDGMRKLIFDLLDLTRIESGQKKREIREVDVRALAQQSMDMVQADAATLKLTLALHAPDALRMWADPGELEIIFNNLFTNAVKYNRPEGRVDVSLASDQNNVLVSVKDTGIGMSVAEQAELFKEFGRIRNDKTRLISGSGLGLSTLKKLVALYDGQIKVASEPNVGTTFAITLKNHPPAASAPGP